MLKLRRKKSMKLLTGILGSEKVLKAVSCEKDNEMFWVP
jgi:hypothetical protein